MPAGSPVELVETYPARMPKVAVVTDSTAGLPADLGEERRILVVPLQVVIGARSYADGVDPEVSPDEVARALKEYRPVSTSRPSPATLLESYERAASEGAEEIVSVHVSGELSGTVESALLAARQAPVPVHVVDSRQVGAGTGYAALTAADVVAAGGTGVAAAAAARRRADAVVSLFFVDTLEYLRRGGRVGAAAALLGSALAVKPILHLEDGRISPLEKVRTTARALARLAELAASAAGERQVDLTVAHLGNRGAADALAGTLAESLAGNLSGREVAVAEVTAVLGAHVGPGLVGVTIAPR
ncbi:MAG: fatty acid kinase fatty acid binding subunit [Nocardioidaceae bacterium]|nr:fatty acid kinase fatty acid binding subunit [Nocardioidaceae bacterium]